MAEEINTARLIVNIPEELDQRIRDTALILGVKVGELVTKGLDKYLDAVAAKKGAAFQQVLKSLAEVRASDDEE